MTNEDIIRMAREAGIPETATEGVFIANSDDLGRLIAAEREACAKVCENMCGPIEIYNPAYVHYVGCAEAIRARGQG
jgi:hypothetical protein